jgi:phage shock protein E
MLAKNSDSSPKSNTVSTSSDTNSKQTVKQLASGTTVFDVRTAEEFATSHVKDATLLPLQDMQGGSLPQTAKDAPIAVYCRSGNRSGQATTLLKEQGYTNVTDLGGLDDLGNYGLSVQ